MKSPNKSPHKSPNKHQLTLILFLLMLKLNPLYGQTYMYIGKLGAAPVWKRAEKIYGEYSVCTQVKCETFVNKHIGFSHDGYEDSLPTRKEYTFCSVRYEHINSKQILSGMNACEVLLNYWPGFKEVNGNEETWFSTPDKPSIKFKDGIVN